MLYNESNFFINKHFNNIINIQQIIYFVPFYSKVFHKINSTFDNTVDICFVDLLDYDEQ